MNYLLNINKHRHRIYLYRKKSNFFLIFNESLYCYFLPFKIFELKTSGFSLKKLFKPLSLPI